MTNSLRMAAAMVAGILGLFGLSGCFETKQEFTLNPDGSGKVVHECSFQPINLTGNSDADPEAALKSAIADVLEDSKGVDVWKDVTYKRLDDGRINFKGTAYFKSLNELKIQNQTLLEFTWATDAAGKGELKLKKEKSDDGEADGEEKEEPKVLTDAERTAKVKEERAKFQQSKPMVAAMLGTMQQSVLFHLPGEPTEVSNFSKREKSLAIKMDGGKLLTSMETLMADDTYLSANGNISEDGPAFDDGLNQMLFGTKGPVRAVVAQAKVPAFDYAAEVAAAQEGFAATRSALGVAKPTGPAAKGDPLKSISLIGIQSVFSVPRGFDFRPFNSEVGVTLALAAEFSGSILSLSDDSAVTVATANDGSNLLNKRGRTIQSDHLSEDQTTVMFEVPLASPKPGVSAIKELSGTLEYTVSAGTREVDLGFTSLEAKAEGTELGAVIKSIDAAENELTLSVNLSPNDIVSFEAVAGAKRIPLERSGYMGFNKEYSYTLRLENKLPADAKLVVTVHDNVQTFTAPFSLKNINLR
jgi:hypothetical protein